MRALPVLALLTLAACSQPGGAVVTSPPPKASPTASATAPCKLPLWWTVALSPGQGEEIHVGFVTIPGGAATDAGALPPPVQTPNGLPSLVFDAATYTTSGKWVRVARNVMSADEKRFVYWDTDQSGQVMHVVDLASGSDRVIYTGASLYVPIAFLSDAIYLSRAINLRQGSLENLYRLDPSGGLPQLVPGSDRHMYQWAWINVADGAAWGIDYKVEGTTYTYSLLRLDLQTSEVQTWLAETPEDLIWPLGVDGRHRLYAADQQHLWRVDSPGNAVSLPNPGPIMPGSGTGVETGFVADSRGAWFPGRGGVWLYADGQEPREFMAGSANSTTYPAGTCLS